MRELFNKYLTLPIWGKLGIVIVMILILGFIVVALFWPPWGGSILRVQWVEQPVMLRILEGEVEIYSGINGQYLGSSDETWLNAGDYIKAKGNSLAVLQYFDGSAVLVEGPAEVTQSWSRSIKSSSLTDGRSICLKVSQGYVAVSAVDQSSPHSYFETCTPGSVGIVEGTIFEVTVDEFGAAIWETSQGTIRVAGLSPDTGFTPKVTLNTLDAGYMVCLPGIPHEWQEDTEVYNKLIDIARHIAGDSVEQDQLEIKMEGASFITGEAEKGLAVYKITERVTAATETTTPALPHGYTLIQNQSFSDEAPGVLVAKAPKIIKPFFPYLAIPDIWRTTESEIVRETAPVYLFSVFDIDRPMGIAVDPAGQRIYVTQTDGDRTTLAFDTDGNHIMTLAPPGTIPAERSPSYVAVDWRGTVYVSDRSRHAIDMYDCKSRYIGTFVPKNNPDIVWYPLGLAFDTDGNFYVTEVTDTNHRILIFNPSSELILEFGGSGKNEGQFYYPNDVAVDKNGQIFVSDSNNFRIQVFSSQGQLLGQFSRSGEEEVGFPRGIDIEANYLYVVDTFGHTVRVYDIEKGMSSVFNFGSQGMGNGEFDFPNGIAIDPNGKIYITDRENNRIQVMGYPPQ